jgi:hypothetical protein
VLSKALCWTNPFGALVFCERSSFTLSNVGDSRYAPGVAAGGAINSILDIGASTISERLASPNTATFMLHLPGGD